MAPMDVEATDHAATHSPSGNVLQQPEAAQTPSDTTVKKENIALAANSPPQSMTSPETVKASVPVELPSVAKQAQSLARRRHVADWVESLTGQRLPIDTDLEFRQALRDGVTLCQLLNILRPGTVGKVLAVSGDSGTSQRIRSMENATTFLKAVQALGIQQQLVFNWCDLEASGPEERPRVVETLLSLQRLHDAKDLRTVVLPQRPSPMAAASPTAATALGAPRSPAGPLRFSVDGSPIAAAAAMQPRGSPAAAAAAGPMAAGSPGDEFSFEAARSMVARQQSGGGNAEGVIDLMHQCTTMLKQRMLLETPGSSSAPMAASSSMGSPGTPGGNRAAAGGSAAAGMGCGVGFDAVGPVLESVLGNLTQEYEKRLLAKDQEVKAAAEGQQRLQSQVVQLRQQLMATAEELSKVKRLTAPGELQDEERLELEALREREADLEALRREAQQQEAAAREKEALAMQLEDECEELRATVDGFQDLADRYRSVADENRRLYNEVQDLKGSIRVFCRVRPLGATGDECAPSCIDLSEEDGEVAVFNPRHNTTRTFRFDRVFGPASTQEQVYDDTKALIRSVLDGYNVCIFAYGQTGSGKTHTMAGTDIERYEGRGINYRALDDLFELNRERADEVQYDIQVQLLEIYNEQLRDLLVDTAGGRPQRLEIQTTKKSGNNVPEATQVRVACTEDVLDVMEVGHRNRSVAETKMNERSSRSHSVLTVSVNGSNQVTGLRSHGCLHLIDLAGSERVLKSEATGERLEEAKYINKSLSALGDVMSSLASKAPHVPFRNSKLTQLLQDSLSGQAKAMMFMHVAPEESSHGESVSTLGFGARVSEITLGMAKKNVESGAVVRNKERMEKLEQQAERERQQREQLASELEERERAMQQMAFEKASMERQMAELQAQLMAAPRGLPSACESAACGTENGTPAAMSRRPASPFKAGSRLASPSMQGSALRGGTGGMRGSMSGRMPLDLASMDGGARYAGGACNTPPPSANKLAKLPRIFTGSPQLGSSTPASGRTTPRAGAGGTTPRGTTPRGNGGGGGVSTPHSARSNRSNASAFSEAPSAAAGGGGGGFPRPRYPSMRSGAMPGVAASGAKNARASDAGNPLRRSASFVGSAAAKAVAAASCGGGAPALSRASSASSSTISVADRRSSLRRSTSDLPMRQWK